MKPYDIFLVAAPKDFGKLPVMLKGLTANLIGYEQIHLCTPKKIPPEFYDPIAKYPIHYHLDKDVLQYDINSIRYRPPWHYQQFLKLFQKVTPNEYYYTCDCDVMLLQNLKLWRGDQPVWHYGWPQSSTEYYRFIKEMLGVDLVPRHTWLADMNFFSHKYIDEMVASKFDSVDAFLKKAQEIITIDCRCSEADLYMQYMMTNHPEVYIEKQLRLKAIGKNCADAEAQIFGVEQIRKEIDLARTEGMQAVALHSWNDLQQYPW